MSPAGLIAAGETGAPWLALVIRLPALRRRPHDPLLRAWYVAVLAVAVAFTVFSPRVFLWIDRFTGTANFAQLLGNEAVVVGCAGLLVFLAHIDHSGQPRWRRTWRLWSSGAAVGLLLALLFLRIPSRPDQPDYWGHYAALPGVAGYRLVWLGYLGVVAFQVARQCLRLAGWSPRPVIRLGLRVVAAGAALGCVDAVDESARVLGPVLGAHWLVPLTGSRTLSTAAVVLCVVGDTLQSWGPRLGMEAALIWVEEYRSLRHLYPIWRALCEAAPAVVLTAPRGRLPDALDVRDVRFRLYRRVVEIRDAAVLLAAEESEPAALIAALQAQSFDSGGSDLRAEAAQIAQAAAKVNVSRTLERGRAARTVR